MLAALGRARVIRARRGGEQGHERAQWHGAPGLQEDKFSAVAWGCPGVDFEEMGVGSGARAQPHKGWGGPAGTA